MAGSGNMINSRWFLATASVAGAKRTHRNGSNQDAVCYLTEPGNDLLVVAVCDGAGAAQRGGPGAETAASAAVEYIRSELERQPETSLTDLLREAIRCARQAIVARSEVECSPLREYATTMTLFVHWNGRSASAQVGDGACVVGVPDQWMLVNEPQRGEHANETWFLTASDAVERAVVSGEYHDVGRVLLCTDGMMNLVLKQPGNVPHPPYFDGTFSWLENSASQELASCQMEQLLLSDRVRRLVDDDLTMFQATLLNLSADPLAPPSEDVPEVSLQDHRSEVADKVAGELCDESGGEPEPHVQEDESAAA